MMGVIADLMFFVTIGVVVLGAIPIGSSDGHQGRWFGVLYVAIAPVATIFLLHAAGVIFGRGGPNGYGALIFLIVGWLLLLLVWGVSRALANTRP